MEAPYICRGCAIDAGWRMPPGTFTGTTRQCGVCGRYRYVMDTEDLGYRGRTSDGPKS